MFDLFITAAAAQSVAHGPLATSEALPTTIMVFVAMLMGAVNFIHKVRRGLSRVFNLAELVGEMFISGMCGLTAFWGFKGLGVNEYLVAAGVAIAGHMGTRAIFLMEQIVDTWLEKHGLIQPKAKL